MRVSVVIPCHDARPYLAQTIGSVLDQTRPPDEIVIVDDGSRDGSLEMACAFAAREPGRVRVLSEPSGRASRTRNIGALAATGDALLFLDADDVLGPDALAALAETLGREPGGIAACPWYRLKYLDGCWVAGPPSCAPRHQGQDALAAWLTGWYYPPCAVLWSRAAFERAGRWDERTDVNQDGDLVMRALAEGVPLAESSRGSAYYRRAPEGRASVSGRRATPEGLASRLRVIRKIAFLLEWRGRIEPYRAAIVEALSAVADDARHADPALAGAIHALQRRYRPGLFARTAARAPRRTAARLAPAVALTPPPGGEVRFGLDYAAATLGGSPHTGATAAARLARPAVSVVIPTYNRAHLLPRALESVLAQTFGDFEVLVVDDGSTDGTAEVLAGCADPRLRTFRQERNAGAGAARNRGLREARADFVAFLDSDDEWLPAKLERQVALLRSLPADVGLVYSGVETVRAGGRRTVERPQRRGDVYREMLASNVIHGGGSNVLMRRDVVATAGFFDEQLPAIEDYEYWLRVTRFFQVDFVDEPLIRYYSPDEIDRRSLARPANLAARWWMYDRYAAEMRRAGMAHLFLLKGVRRAMSPPHPDLAEARRLAWRAVLEAPTSRLALAALKRALFPPPQRQAR